MQHRGGKGVGKTTYLTYPDQIALYPFTCLLFVHPPVRPFISFIYLPSISSIVVGVVHYLLPTYLPTVRSLMETEEGVETKLSLAIHLLG